MALTASFLEGEGLGIVETEEAEELILVGVDAERVPALAGEETRAGRFTSVTGSRELP